MPKYQNSFNPAFELFLEFFSEPAHFLGALLLYYFSSFLFLCLSFLLSSFLSSFSSLFFSSFFFPFHFLHFFPSLILAGRPDPHYYGMMVSQYGRRGQMAKLLCNQIFTFAVPCEPVLRYMVENSPNKRIAEIGAGMFILFLSFFFFLFLLLIECFE